MFLIHFSSFLIVIPAQAGIQRIRSENLILSKLVLILRFSILFSFFFKDQ